MPWRRAAPGRRRSPAKRRRACSAHRPSTQDEERSDSGEHPRRSRESATSGWTRMEHRQPRPAARCIGFQAQIEWQHGGAGVASEHQLVGRAGSSADSESFSMTPYEGSLNGQCRNTSLRSWRSSADPRRTRQPAPSALAGSAHRCRRQLEADVVNADQSSPQRSSPS